MPYTEKKYKQQITLGQGDNAIIKIIAITTIFFVGLAFMKAVWYFSYPKETALALFNKNVLGLFTMPASFSALLLKPWTVLTQMFVHDNLWEVFGNMLWLWSFGYILQDLTGNKKIIPLFLYASFAGSIAFLLTYNLIPSLAPQLPYAVTMGASAGVMALAIATTMLAPNYRIFPMIRGGIPMWVLTAFYLLSNVFSISYKDTGNIMLHIAGGLTGAAYIFFLQRGYDWGGWMNTFFEWVGNLFNPHIPKKGKSFKEEIFYKPSTAPFTKKLNLTQQRVDEILDKINQKGYNQLTEEEKELLKRASEL